jgi:REP element-mobilizing transposase RayT
MSPVKPIFDPANLYFITTTAVNKYHFFHPQGHKHIIIGSLEFMREQQWLKLYAFVVMPNHIHLMVRILSPHNLQDMMRDFKKFTSKKIVEHCQLSSNLEFLSKFEQAGERNAKTRYKVWSDGYDAREIFTLEFLEQKLDYIHHNPCQPHWKLVENPEDYRWSSAGFYIVDRPAIIEIDDLREFLVD